MNNTKTPAEFASKLYSYLDSSGGDYHELLSELDELEQTRQVQEITDNIENADDLLSEVFNILDNTILQEIEYNDSIDSDARFNEEADIGNEIQTVVNKLSEAVDLIHDSVKTAQNIDLEPDDFKFGVHTDIESALSYLDSDIEAMEMFAEEMKNYL